MPMTLRATKGSALTHAELDGNFSELFAKIGAESKFSVRKFGAVGDGSVHPAQTYINDTYGSGTITTLAGLQAWNGGIYSFATALTNQMDWLGTQAAINAAAAADYQGGPVYVDGGNFYFDQELVAPDPTDGDNVRGYRKSLWLIGAGTTNTNLIWPNDLGVGKFALRNAGTVDTGPGTHYMHVEGVRFLGPSTAVVLGTKSVQMSGWRMGTRYEAHFSAFNQFGIGVVVWGNHNALVSCIASDNYYNVFFDNTLSLGHQGDHYFANTNLSGARFASIGVGYNSTCDSATFISTSIGFAPYGLYKESKGGNARTYTGVITNSTLLDFAIEACGNAAIYCENTDDNFENNYWAGGPGTDLLDDYYIAARGRSSLYRMGQVANNQFFVDLGWPGVYSKITAGLIEVQGGFVGNTFHHVINMINHGSGKTAIKLIGGSFYDNKFTGPQRRGDFLSAAGTITAGELVKISPNPANGQVERMTAGAGAIFAGVALTNAVQGDIIPIAVSGLMTVGKSVGTAMSAGPVESDPAAPTKVRGWTAASGRPNAGFSSWFPDTGSGTVEIHLRVGMAVSSG